MRAQPPDPDRQRGRVTWPGPWPLHPELEARWPGNAEGGPMPSPRTTVSAGRNRDPQATSHQLRALTRSPVWTYALTWGLGHRGAPPPSRKRAAGVAFDLLDGLGTPNDGIFGARCPAHAHLYRRFACLLAKADARLKARMVRQSFPSPDFHRLSTTKLGWRSQDLPLLPPISAMRSGFQCFQRVRKRGLQRGDRLPWEGSNSRLKTSVSRHK